MRPVIRKRSRDATESGDRAGSHIEPAHPTDVRIGSSLAAACDTP